MKLDKSIVQRRLDLMAAEGVVGLVHSMFLGPTKTSEL
jgi:NADPH-dependent glutamate synthase beta subunit-like oxidoreductase